MLSFSRKSTQEVPDGVASTHCVAQRGIENVADTLIDLFERAARSHSGRTAVVEPGAGELTYEELDALADQVRDRLVELGVGRGDRVGLQMRKSVDALATVLGILKAGAAYVPVDPDGPVERAAYILADCTAKVVVVEERLAEDLVGEMEACGHRPRVLGVNGTGGGGPLAEAVESATKAEAVHADPDDVSYILYTSGSTGRPKGVILTHRNAVAFVDWCSDTFAPVEEDRFSSHAPLHFDLSILDLYVPLRHGATLVLIDAEAGKNPQGLADLIAEERISIWYSAPSILSMLVQFGRLERHDYPDLRMVFFAGEVFPVKYLRALKERLPRPRYFNLYGPTETNVCTWHEIPEIIDDQRTDPYPIGKVCPHLRGRVVDEDGRDVAPGESGELWITGPNVMRGYWNLPEATERGLVEDDGNCWYRTGDIVREDDAGDLVFQGRRDRMVKRRGYRIELAEIETGLYRHPLVEEAAVLADSDDTGVRITAFLSVGPAARPSIIELRRFCTEHIAEYMVPDRFEFRERLPRTSTDKVDYQSLRASG
jgi:amino acid adenylation domain-containing protein